MARIIERPPSLHVIKTTLLCIRVFFVVVCFVYSYNFPVVVGWMKWTWVFFRLSFVFVFFLVLLFHRPLIFLIPILQLCSCLVYYSNYVFFPSSSSSSSFSLVYGIKELIIVVNKKLYAFYMNPCSMLIVDSPSLSLPLFLSPMRSSCKSISVVSIPFIELSLIHISFTIMLFRYSFQRLLAR